MGVLKTDIEIANSVELKPITEIAASIGISADELELYGKYKAKVNAGSVRGDGKLVLVTAINPTAAGEGKTTVSVGLADGMKRLKYKAALALREPSLGPVFGIKGGAAGGGWAQVAPMSDINLHFTGDMHAVTAACNLLSAIIDNHLYFGNNLRIKNVSWRRCTDTNDRALRNIVVGLGGEINGVPREDGFTITAASEIMSILCLSVDLDDLKRRLGDIIIGTDVEGGYVRAAALKCVDAMAILLKDAIKPNLVQTLEGTPAFVHGGPFANIAHGCNTVRATNAAMTYADYTVTEAGFGADLGAEKFLNIKCRTAGISPDCVVIVATVRALKSSGGVDKANLSAPDAAAVEAGSPNLVKHIENITKCFGLKCTVAVNKFVTDTQEEIDTVKRVCAKAGVKAIECDVWAKGGEGAEELAAEVVRLADTKGAKHTFTYDDKDSIEDKVTKVATKIYGAAEVEFLPAAVKSLAQIKAAGLGHLPVCIAKTQYSLSDNAALKGAPTGFKVTVREVLVRGGAGFVVAVAGNIMLMPGLARVPNAEMMTINNENDIIGLF